MVHGCRSGINRIRGIPQFRSRYPQQTDLLPQPGPQAGPKFEQEVASGDQNGAGEECAEGGQAAEGASGSPQCGTARRGVDRGCRSGEPDQ